MDRLEQLLRNLRDRCPELELRTEEPMSRHTTFRIGGPAALMALPRTVGEAKAAVRAAGELEIRPFFLGNGSNLLVRDGGVIGLVIVLGERFSHIEIHDNILTAQAGASLNKVAAAAQSAGLSGLEFASGIPGTLGGGCAMNAGAYGGCVADVLKSVRVVSPDGSIDTLGVDELELGYRRSRVASEGLVVLSATFALEKGDPEKIRATMDDLMRRREEKQPLELPSAGSTFKRPEGHFAGKLIMDAGLRGHAIGGAQVSEKHCGFIVNADHATAADVDELIRHIQATVKDQFGVDLQPEVHRVGEFL